MPETQCAGFHNLYGHMQSISIWMFWYTKYLCKQLNDYMPWYLRYITLLHRHITVHVWYKRNKSIIRIVKHDQCLDTILHLTSLHRGLLPRESTSSIDYECFVPEDNCKWKRSWMHQYQSVSIDKAGFILIVPYWGKGGTVSSTLKQ